MPWLSRVAIAVIVGGAIGLIIAGVVAVFLSRWGEGIAMALSGLLVFVIGHFNNTGNSDGSPEIDGEE